MNKFFKILFLVAVLELGILIGMYMVINSHIPNWNCNAEDEVVVIDNSCRHIDTL